MILREPGGHRIGFSRPGFHITEARTWQRKTLKIVESRREFLTSITYCSCWLAVYLFPSSRHEREFGFPPLSLTFPCFFQVQDTPSCPLWIEVGGGARTRMVFSSQICREVLVLVPRGPPEYVPGITREGAQEGWSEHDHPGLVARFEGDQRGTGVPGL